MPACSYFERKLSGSFWICHCLFLEGLRLNLASMSNPQHGPPRGKPRNRCGVHSKDLVQCSCFLPPFCPWPTPRAVILMPLSGQKQWKTVVSLLEKGRRKCHAKVPFGYSRKPVSSGWEALYSAAFLPPVLWGCPAVPWGDARGLSQRAQGEHDQHVFGKVLAYQ